MIAVQQQNLEAFVRVGVFVDQHPLPGPLTYSGPREALAEAVLRLRAYAAAQLSAGVLSVAETRVQARLIRRITQRHMRPIVAIARRPLEPDAAVPLPAALRLPRPNIRATRLLQAADGMIEAVRPFEARFIAQGMPDDFLARFTAVRDELAGALGGRAVHIGTQVGATKGLAVEVRRGRNAVERLDAIVRASFDGDEVTLAEWRAARRVRLVPGGGGAGAGTGTLGADVASAAAGIPAAPVAEAAEALLHRDGRRPAGDAPLAVGDRSVSLLEGGPVRCAPGSAPVRFEAMPWRPLAPAACIWPAADGAARGGGARHYPEQTPGVPCESRRDTQRARRTDETRNPMLACRMGTARVGT